MHQVSSPNRGLAPSHPSPRLNISCGARVFGMPVTSLGKDSAMHRNYCQICLATSCACDHDWTRALKANPSKGGDAKLPVYGKLLGQRGRHNRIGHSARITCSDLTRQDRLPVDRKGSTRCQHGVHARVNECKQKGCSEKSKPGESLGRKATGLRDEILGQRGCRINRYEVSLANVQTKNRNKNQSKADLLLQVAQSKSVTSRVTRTEQQT